MIRFFCCASIILALTLSASAQAPEPIESWTGKTVMLFSPHPDDDTLCCGGTLAMLAKQRNRVLLVLYTNGNKGSRDLEMTADRLAAIRTDEETAAAQALGIPKENIVWLAYDDGELEYVPQQPLLRQVVHLIRKYRPDVVMSVDPGEVYEKWHKTDHRMAGIITLDAIRTAEFHLNFPEHYLYEGLKPYRVPLFLFFYAARAEENYWVNIENFVDVKVEALSKHVSQMSSADKKYRPDWDPAELAKFKNEIRTQAPKRDGRYVEGFRRATEFAQQ
jgi:LmbE family N-acetylglucosaminyl deacetylase